MHFGPPDKPENPTRLRREKNYGANRKQIGANGVSGKRTSTAYLRPCPESIGRKKNRDRKTASLSEVFISLALQTKTIVSVNVCFLWCPERLEM